MKMSVLARALLVYFGSLFYFADGAFVDFQLATSTKLNRLTLECVSSVTGDVDRLATVYFFSPNGDRDEPTGSVFSGGIFDFTPMNEAFLRCTSGDGEQSEFVAIAGMCLEWKGRIEWDKGDSGEQQGGGCGWESVADLRFDKGGFKSKIRMRERLTTPTFAHESYWKCEEMQVVRDL